MKKFLITTFALIPCLTIAQTTFEMRYFTSDPKADGITDFRGPTQWYDTEQRVEVLGKYARFGSRFWGDPGMDTPLVTDETLSAQLRAVKPQPLTSVRRTIPLEQWTAWGEGGMKNHRQDTLKWRFRLKASYVDTPDGVVATLFHTNGKETVIPIGRLREFEIYGDLPSETVFLSSGGKTVKEISVPNIPVANIDVTEKNGQKERMYLYNFVLHPDDWEAPYWSEVVYDRRFGEEPYVETVTLPSARGGAAEAGETYHLRTTVKVGSFATAFLHIDALDPAGSVWINGEPAAVLDGRTPWNLNVARFLRPEAENTIDVYVKPFYTDQTSPHCPSDHNFGWFLGKTQLILTDTPTRIKDAFVYTSALEGNDAVQHHKITVRRDGAYDFFTGKLVIRYSTWFPDEGAVVKEEEIPVEIRPRTENVIEADARIHDALLWSTDAPALYKVEFILKDGNGIPVDDYVTTTGIRKIEQKNAVLYVNGKPEVLGGGQIFGFRLPLETVAKTVYCPTDEQLMRELMMARAMGNTLRIHVHARTLSPEGTNDPRIAQWADQMGLYLIWQTPAWTREGEPWNVDIANYPVYMKEVFNHPSIVMWEAANHPNWFDRHSAKETQDYMHAIIPAIALTDSSRLISPTTAWDITHYGNFEGTVDKEGNPLEKEPWLMHPMMTRGNQDSYTGYDNDWSHVRELSHNWARWTLEAGSLCYFNFEHEESIAQPNWELARKEPWYHMNSYEKNYEKDNIGRLLTFDEWKESQAYQAMGAWESMKMQLLQGVSGFSWCSLESGPNMFTYQKPVIDPFTVPKLAFHANRMALQRIWAGSADVDTVYGPEDMVRPVIFNLDHACRVMLEVQLQDEKGRVLERKVFKDVDVAAGRSTTTLPPFRFKTKKEECYFIVYKLTEI